MQKLYEFLAIKKTEGDIGIEIEVEGDNLPRLENNYWTSVEDNSLRNGREYIFTKPRPFKFVPKMVNLLNSEFQKANSNLVFSFRTSVHVHVNVQQFTWTQVLNFIYTYLLLEEPMMEFCHPVRRANRFCLRLADAEGILSSFSGMFRNTDHDVVRYIRQNMMRYSALNVEALLKYGSLEFRALEGNVDTERISTWCKFIEKIYNYALKVESPSHIYDEFIKISPKDFVNIVMEEVAEKLVVDERQMLRSFSLSIELPFEYKAGAEERDKVKMKVGNKISNEKVRRVLEPRPWDILPAGGLPAFPDRIRGNVIMDDLAVNVPQIVARF